MSIVMGVSYICIGVAYKGHGGCDAWVNEARSGGSRQGGGVDACGSYRELACGGNRYVRGNDGQFYDAPAVDARVWRLGLDPIGT